MKRFIKINPADNVAVVLADDAKTGDTFADGVDDVKLIQPVPRGHKIALRDIAKDETVISPRRAMHEADGVMPHHKRILA